MMVTCGYPPLVVFEILDRVRYSAKNRISGDPEHREGGISNARSPLT